MGQNSPAGQERQAALDVDAEFGPYVPAEQFVGVMDLTGQKLPEGQTVQSLCWAAPSIIL